MSVLDLLLADALASGLARALAEDRPPPDNFFVIPPILEACNYNYILFLDLLFFAVYMQAWLKIKSSCNRENMVICLEVTDDGHPGCRQVQPLFMELARKIQQIPFFRVKIGLGCTHNKVCQQFLYIIIPAPSESRHLSEISPHVFIITFP